MKLGNDVEMGPGLIRIKADILDDPGSLAPAKAEIAEMLNQIPLDWDAVVYY